MISIFKEVFDPQKSDLESSFCLFCSWRMFEKYRQDLPWTELNCKTETRKTTACDQSSSTVFDKYFSKKATESDIIEYLSFLLKKKLDGHSVDGKTQWFIKKYLEKNGYKLNLKKKNPIERKQESHRFYDFTPSLKSKEISTDQIPYTNTKTTKNADFFSRLYFLFYHLETSIRNFLSQRLYSILGEHWEDKIINNIDLSVAISIRKETELSVLFPKRGDTILNYCRWTDYGKIIAHYKEVFNNKGNEENFIAHLDSIRKIRNSIAHNAETIDKRFLDELDVFLLKFIDILK